MAIISLLVPTFSKPQNMQRIWNSALNTASAPQKLEIVFYIEEHDLLSLKQFEKMDGHGASSQVQAILGEKLTVYQMWNECQKFSKGDIVATMNDNLVFKLLGWDTIVKQSINSCTDKIICVSGANKAFSFVHKNWTKALGSLCKNYLASDLADSIKRYKLNLDIFSDDIPFEVDLIKDNSKTFHTDAEKLKNFITNFR